MKTRMCGQSSWFSTRLSTLLLLMTTGLNSLAQPLPKVTGLIDAGDYYLNRDGSVIPLWRAKQEIALRRDKTLSQDTALHAAAGKDVLLSADWYITNKIEVYTTRLNQSDTGPERATLIETP